MPKGKKGFQKGNELGFEQTKKRPVSKTKVFHVRPFEDQIVELELIEGLPDKIREFFDELISGQSDGYD